MKAKEGENFKDASSGSPKSFARKHPIPLNQSWILDLEFESCLDLVSSDVFTIR